MRWLNLLAAVSAASVMVGEVHGVGFEQNGGSCEEADRKYGVYEYQGSRTENFYGPLDPATLQVLPPGCVPSSLNVYGAWYKVNFPGSAGLTLDSSAFSKDGIDANQTISVMEGSCAALTCAAYADAVPNGKGGRDGAAIFTLKANTDYFVLYTVANVPGAAVPQIGIKPLNAEAACKWYRSDQITNPPYSGDGLGTCTPCVSETAADGSGTVWSTTCSDACQKCYDVGGAPFCYNEQRQWMIYTPNVITVDNPEVLDIDYCYNFTDGNVVCDQGTRDGACPGRGVSVNGVACSDCVQQYDAVTCENDATLAYGNFKADCSAVGDGSGVMDKCTNTGFDTSPALYNYAVYTDLVLANLYGQGAFTPEYQGQCAVYTEEGFPVETPAPTAIPVADPAIAIDMDDRTDEFDVAQDQNVLFTIDVSNSVGIVECEVRGDNGDIDLYVGVDTVPLVGEFTGCKSTLFGSEDACSVLVDGAFEINVIANGYRAATDATVKCELTKLSDARTYDVGVDVKKDFDLDANQYRLYKMEIPDNTARVSCETKADDGDLDLWLRMGNLPQPYVEGRWDCGSNTFTGNEYCELTDYISNNDLYILLQGYGNVTNGELECVATLSACGNCLNSDDAEELRLDQAKGGWSLLENENKLFYVRAPEESRKIWCNLDTDDGDVDLYMRVEQVPVLPGENFGGGEFDCGSLSPTGNEYCFYEWTENTGNPRDVNVYALVTGYGATKNIRINCDGDVPLTKDDSERIRDGRVYGTDLERDEEVLVHIEIAEGTDELICFTDARDGDVDVFSKKNEVPKRYNGNDQVNAEGSGNEHTITWEFFGGLDDGAYGDEIIYILLAGFERTRDVEILCEEFYFEIIEAGKRRKVKREASPKVIVSSP